MALALPLVLSSAFVAFDDCLANDTGGVTVVTGPREALVAHTARRLRAVKPVVISADLLAVPLFYEAALRIGIVPPNGPADCAAALARVTIIAPVPEPGSWDEAVAQELARCTQSAVVLVTDTAAPAWATRTFDVTDLDRTAKARFLDAAIEEAADALGTRDLARLEEWWSSARKPEAVEIDAHARRLADCLALAGRSLAFAAARHLGVFDPERATTVLARHGVAAFAENGVAPLKVLGAPAPELRLRVATLLAGERDVWSRARAAELLLEAGHFERADAAASHALAEDERMASAIAARWFSAVEPIAGDVGFMLRMRAARRALLRGEAIDARRWCESASELRPDEPTTALLLGRALMQLGDLVAARACFTRAEGNAKDDEVLASVAAERAEASFLGGELGGAEQLAREALERTRSAATRLAARGTIGKVLLANGAWDAADAHFAEDALSAHAAGESSAELRARLNRAIALLSRGDLTEAQTVLEAVLADGTRLGDDRARAFALSNLGLVAYRQHDYATALGRWEQAIRFPQALRGRLATALTIGNLAELRLRLGLVDHAEHAIAFGRKLLGQNAPPRCIALFRWVSAQIALARGDTTLARREIDLALEAAETSNERDYLESSITLSVRIALADGDLTTAERELARATQIAKSARAASELAILRAAQARALGQPALDLARTALDLAKDEDLLAEAHFVLAIVHGNSDAARFHATSAARIRDRVAASLPPEIRTAFLAKPETVALSRLLADNAPSSVNIVKSELPPPARDLVGDDPQIKSLVNAIRKVARAQSTVLIRGESGTGKELVAEALHRASERASGPLVTVNCAALVETLLLSELFGHEKGAFTGAASRRRGRFELAEGGTLFLDEIGDISARTQVALLRVLQEKTFERVGGTRAIQANVRVVCATHRDLRAMVERGDFREDLYYRLRGITLEVPPLRARLGDLPKLAEHLLRRVARERSEPEKTLGSDALELLVRHRWPGNVRELENALRAASLFAEGGVIGAPDLIENVDDLRLVAAAGPSSQRPFQARTRWDDDEEAPLPEATPETANATAVAYAHVRQGALSLANMKRQIERDCIARALEETRGNITRAAALLGMKRPRLSQLVKQYGLNPEGL